jgi:hypothetical protein
MEGIIPKQTLYVKNLYEKISVTGTTFRRVKLPKISHIGISPFSQVGADAKQL